MVWHPGERLLLVNIANRDGVVTMRTVWATTPDHRAGPRRTDVETLADRSALMRRLPGFIQALCWLDPELEPPDAVAAPAPELAAPIG